MDDPRSRIIRHKTDGHIVRGAGTQGGDIAPDGIHEIRLIATRNPDNVEVELTNSLVRDKEWWRTTYAMQMHSVLKNGSRVSKY